MRARDGAPSPGRPSTLLLLRRRQGLLRPGLGLLLLLLLLLLRLRLRRRRRRRLPRRKVVALILRTDP